MADGLLVTKMVARGRSVPDSRAVNMEDSVRQYFGSSSSPSRIMSVLSPAEYVKCLAISCW